MSRRRIPAAQSLRGAFPQLPLLVLTMANHTDHDIRARGHDDEAGSARRKPPQMRRLCEPLRGITPGQTAVYNQPIVRELGFMPVKDAAAYMREYRAARRRPIEPRPVSTAITASLPSVPTPATAAMPAAQQPAATASM